MSEFYPGEFIIDDSYAIKNQDALMMAGARGYDPSSVDPSIYGMMAPPSEIALIPRSEWSERIKQKEQTKSRLSDILLRAGIPSTDQNGDGYCATDDTEVLTERGWVAYPDYNWVDPLATVNPMTHAMEFQKPFQRHVYEYDGPMVYSTNRRIDFGVTPDHQMYVRKWDESKRTLSDKYSFVKAGDLGWYAGLMHAPRGWTGIDLVEVEVPGDRRYDGDDFIAMLALIISDGYAGGAEGSRPGKGTRNWVSFASFREESREAVAALAARVGFHESPSRRGVWMRYGAGALAEWIRQYCYTSSELKAQTKRVPEVVKCVSGRQITQFLHWFDDRNRNGTFFYSTSKRLADDIQELLLRIGKRGSVATTPAKKSVLNGKEINSKGGYQVYVSETERLCLERKKHIETDHYKGLVYCAAVPNHTLLTRRNGSVLISSNCWAYSTVGCVQAVRAFNNQPHIPLNPHSVAATIKRGADQGGWCGLSCRFLMEHGVAPMGAGEGQWPEHSRDYQRHEPRCRDRMSQFKVTEGWIDLGRRDYDQQMTFDQVASCLLANIPCALDFNWWGHSVMGCDLVEVSRNQFGIRIRNSWTDGWGDKGFSVLAGSKTIPNGAVGLRVTGGVAA